MVTRKERATGSSVGAVCGFLTGSFALAVGLTQFLVGLDFVDGGLLALTGYFLAGFLMIGAAMTVFTMRQGGRKIAIPLHVGAIVAFGMMTSGNLGNVSIALVGGIMACLNLIGALALVTSDDVVVGGHTDTSDEHATDIGTGFR